VDHTFYDTTSILKMIETRFDLAPLRERDARANNLLNSVACRHAEWFDHCDCIFRRAIDRSFAAGAVVRDEGKTITAVAAIKAWRIQTGTENGLDADQTSRGLLSPEPAGFGRICTYR
jgi:hypothetical protein